MRHTSHRHVKRHECDALLISTVMLLIVAAVPPRLRWSRLGKVGPRESGGTDNMDPYTKERLGHESIADACRVAARARLAVEAERVRPPARQTARSPWTFAAFLRALARASRSAGRSSSHATSCSAWSGER